jgi:hypothetical protein
VKQIAGFFVYDRSGNHHDMAFTIVRFNFMLKNILKNDKAKIKSCDPKQIENPKLWIVWFSICFWIQVRFSPPGCFSNVFTEAGLNSETAVSGAEGADSKASWGQVWPRSGPKATICDKIWA